MSAGGQSRVLVLGGCGFIGRNLVHYLVTNDLVSFVRVADKVFPATAYLSAAHTATFANEAKVEFMQTNLTNDASIARAFTCDKGVFDIVFNCAAETKYGLAETVYKDKIFDLAVKVATAAVTAGVPKFIQLSTAQVYKSDSRVKDESGKLDPWTAMAQYHLDAETSLLAMPGLNCMVVRPATVYGPGDVSGVSPRLIMGAVYKRIDEKLEFLWGKDLKCNTVHVDDVCAALWVISQSGTPGEIYNLADKGDTDQGRVNTLIEAIFGIKTGFHGMIISNLARTALGSLTDDANEKHLKPWSELCNEAGIENSPLTPYIDIELVRNNNLSINGSKVERLGFTYQHPEMTEALLRAQLNYFVEQGIFPASSIVN